MIFTMQQSDLQHAIERMALPVFVVDHCDDGEFRVVAVNVSHNRATGLEPVEIIGKTPQMILPRATDAAFLNGRYHACLIQRKPISYTAQLVYRDDVKEIHTVLHPVSLTGGAPTRLVGVVTIAEPALEDTVQGALGDPVNGKRVDIQSIEAILDTVRRAKTISSKDLMVLGALTTSCNLTLSDIGRKVEAHERRRTISASSGLAEQLEPSRIDAGRG